LRPALAAVGVTQTTYHYQHSVLEVELLAQRFFEVREVLAKQVHHDVALPLRFFHKLIDFSDSVEAWCKGKLP